MPLTPNTKLGDYEILAAIGAGGMGEVYRARDNKLGREMWIFLLLALVSVQAVATPTVAAAQAPKDIPAIVQQARKAVVLVVASDQTGQETAQGSGFVVSSDGRVVTNYHVIEGAVSALIGGGSKMIKKRHGRQELLTIAVSVALSAALLPATASADEGGGGQPIDIQFLNVSDWHAQLDPLFVFGEGTFGGAAELAAYWDADRAANPNTITLTGGDAYGASPPLSSFFDEEPAVRSMRMMGFDVDTFGNHNFDGGIDHLQRMIDIVGDSPGHEPGRPFHYVSANLENRDDNLSGVEDFVILNRSGVKVAVIGVTNPEAATLVFPGSFGTIEVTDPVAAANAARQDAEDAGADLFVAIAHLGVTGFDDGANAEGPLIDFANGVNGFDVIFGDHTNMEFAGEVNGALVVENRSRGRTYAKVIVTANRKGDVFGKSVEFIDPVSADVTPDPEIVAFLDPLRAELSDLLSGVIGQSTVPIPRADECGQSSGRHCESLIGDVVTDAMRDRYGTDFAIMNSGGLRADLTCPDPDLANDFCPAPDGGDLEITDGQVITVLPFGNSIVTLAVTGAELKDHLERGVSAAGTGSGRFAQVSGLCFTYDIAAAVDSRVTGAVFQAADGTCTGGAVDLTVVSSYTLAENDFMASGGDGYPVDIGSAVTRELLDQVTAEYITANTPISPAIQGRITCTDSVAPNDCPVPVP